MLDDESFCGFLGSEAANTGVNRRRAASSFKRAEV
jgi:hypothetical protein